MAEEKSRISYVAGARARQERPAARKPGEGRTLCASTPKIYLARHHGTRPMKITRTANKFVFHLGKRDKQFFLEVLKFYPRMPSAHRRLSKSAPLLDEQSNQQLLDEALAEQRAENKRHLAELLADNDRFKETESGARLSLLA